MTAEVTSLPEPSSETQRSPTKADHASDRLPRVVQRGLDVAIASAALVCLAPLLASLAVVVRASSRGPALYCQTRIGRGGRPITVRKFRSMCADADELLPALRLLNVVTDGPLFKVRDDPRVTAVGRWMRRFSLDELPQLVNVLGGSMSLVGPRPALPAEVAAYDQVARRRLTVKPGLTGLWQVSGRAELPWSEALRLDLAYVDEWSLRLDLVILLRTLPAVLTARGAY